MVVGFITTYAISIPLRWSILDTTLCDKVCQWLATGLWFSPALNTVSLTPHIHVITTQQTYSTVSVRLWNLQDNCKFYQNFFRTFFLIIKLIFIKYLRENLRNRWANVLGPVPSWVIVRSSSVRYNTEYTQILYMYWTNHTVTCTLYNEITWTNISQF
jgi:hypothetical protein